MIGELVKLEIFVPVTHLESMSEALQSAGVGAFGKYDGVLSYSHVKGRWRPLPGATPYNGKLGEICEADEYKIEACCETEKVKAALKAIKAAHPYEEPVINVLPMLNTL